jgi:hypothetical protein
VRDWTAARAKCDREQACRACCRGPVEAAHIIPRSRVKPGPGEDERNIVPLCRACHTAYDGGRLDILPLLSLEEQSYAVGLVGMAEAMRRITNERMAA